MKPAMTCANTSANDKPLTLDSLKEVIAALDGFEAEHEAKQERALQELFTKYGFDLAAGDLMFVPKGSDLSVIPKKYKDQVRESEFCKDNVLFMKNPALVLF